MPSPFELDARSLTAHQDFVRRLARALTRDAAAADDLAQDVWLNVELAPRSVQKPQSWLATVLRRRAAEIQRAEARRAAREASVARGEAMDQDPSAALERLELSQEVVQAVLSLDEPYRSTVVAIHFEGLSPKAYADRQGASASTVRSQLSRAHVQLRERLDEAHGDRRAWALPLAQLAAKPFGNTPTGSSSSGASSTASAHSVGQMALVGASVAAAAAVIWAVVAQPSAATPEGTPQWTTRVGAAVAALDGAPGPTRLAAIEPAEERVEAEPDALLAELVDLERVPDLLKRARHLKMEILDRALTVAPDLARRFEWLADSGEGDVVRVLERSRYGAPMSLPWMREGGAFYSFSERVHDYNRRPQVAFEGGHIRACSRESVMVPLGAIPLRSIPKDPAWRPLGCEPIRSIEIALAWTDRSASELDFAELRRRSLEESEAAALDRNALRVNPPERGQAYLLRVRAEGEYDLLVAFEILDVEPDGVTLAWRELARWPVADGRSLWVPRVDPSDVGPVPAAITRLADAELYRALAETLAEAQRSLFDDLPQNDLRRFGRLREEEGAGLARLLPYLGPWDELGRGFARGAAISPLSGRHDVPFTYFGYQGFGTQTPTLHPGLDGGVFGVIVDLGEVELDDAHPKLAAEAERAWVSDPYFGLRPDGPPSIVDESDMRDEWSRIRRELHTALEAARRSDTENAVAGHTYLVRSVCPADRNVLSAVHIASMDEYGAVVAWRVLEHAPAEF